MAGGCRRRRLRGAARLRRARVQVDLPRRRGLRRSAALLARRPADPQGAPVGDAPRQGRLPGGSPSPERRGAGAARGALLGLDRVARPLAGARLYDGDGRALRLPRHDGGDREGPGRPRRRLPPARADARVRRLFARVDAPPARDAERPDGVPHRGDDRLGAGARSARGLAQLLRLRRVPPRRRRAAHGAAEARRPLPARAAAQLQPQVLPRVAAPLLLLRTLERPAGRRRRLSARRIASHAARSLGEDARPARAWRLVLALAVAPAAAAPAAADWPE